MESSITQYLYKKTARSKKNSRLSNFFVPQSQEVCGFGIAGTRGFKEEKSTVVSEICKWE